MYGMTATEQVNDTQAGTPLEGERNEIKDDINVMKKKQKKDEMVLEEDEVEKNK